jgi:hypothetical protein
VSTASLVFESLPAGEWGYHSGDVLVELRGLEARAYIAEPDRGRRKWAGKRVE